MTRDRFKTDQHWERIHRYLLQQFKQLSGPNVSEDRLKEVNDAKDVLCDPEKRKKYDAFLKDTPRPKAEDVFDEEFGPNAFDEDDGDFLL
ncbi:hypothetical protein F5Y14DRAFT_414671 [Nemania sp. NC0429]|nr:hypothetical protein F5Y14DRAFT_414671 [Nemania sp. NC0429]